MKKLTDNQQWKQANLIAEHMYGKIGELEQFPDEKWNTERRIRNAANDVIFFVAQGVGSVLPEAAEYDWNNARKSLFALRTLYTFAHKQGFVALDPEIVVNIDTLLADIDTELTKAQHETEEKKEKELEPWLKKYQLWKEMQKNPK